jgi:PAS domain S-box-containing protein
LARAHCEFATGRIADAEERLRRLSNRAVTRREHAIVAGLQVDLYQAVDRNGEAVDVGLRALRHLGVDIPAHPTEVDAQRAYDGVWIRLGTRAIEDLVNVPLMNDSDSLATVDLLIRVAVPGHLFESIYLLAVVVCTVVGLGLERGHSDASCVAYVDLGMLAGPLFGHFDAGYRFGRLGCDLVERPELQRFQARTFEAFGFVMAWTQHVRKGRELIFRAFDIASRIGDISYAGYARGQLNTNYLMAGDPLSEAQEQAEYGLAFARNVGIGTAEAWILGQLGLIRSLRGQTTRLGSFDDAVFRESDLERDLADNPARTFPKFWYYIRKLQARFLAGEYREALNAAAEAEPLLWNFVFVLECVEYHFYAALSHAAIHDPASPEDREYRRARLTEHLVKLDTWALHGPENFVNRAALVGAELARIEGRDVDAMRLYEQSIRSARDHGFVQNEAVAYEVAARFYSARGFAIFADAYLRRARDCYLRWGADGKVRQLDRLYSHLVALEETGPAAISGPATQHLDVASVVKASQAVSGEIVLANLIDRLMAIVIKNAGAERGLLILPSGDEYLIQAEARATGDRIEVTMRQGPITGVTCPESVVRYAIRTGERVILDDASKPNLFSGDDYLRDRRSKSILCLPLIKQRELVGIVLLENELISHAFTPARIAVLELLAAQAAISLENTRLYGDLQERESKVRHLVESNIIGICIYNLDRRILEANDAFLNMLGYSRDDVVSGHLNFADLTPPEWAGSDERRLTQLVSTGTWKPSEKEFFRKDGSRVPVLLGSVIFGELRRQGIAFVLDLTEQKRAEAERARAQEALGLRDLQLRLLVDSIAAPVALMTPSGEVDVVNSAVLDYFGKTLDELKHWSIIDAVHPDDLPHANAAWTAAVESGRPFGIESRHRRFDGVFRWFHVRGFPIRDPDGRLVRWCVLQTDIDDRKKAEAAMRESEERYREALVELAHANRVATMGQLAASIAHEVSQPIAATLTNAETAARWLSRQPPNLEKTRQSIDRIISDGKRSADILSRIRDFSKKAPARKEELEINEAILEIVMLARAAISDNIVSVRMQLSDGLPRILGDRVQLQQVILNLIMNAVEAMSEVGEGPRELSIGSSRVETKSILVAIGDSGPGLPPTSLARIFEPFYTTKPNGLGMGLSICRSIVEAHGGRLWVTPNEFRGAVFRVMLPIVEKSLEKLRSSE